MAEEISIMKTSKICIPQHIQLRWARNYDGDGCGILHAWEGKVNSKRVGGKPKRRRSLERTKVDGKKVSKRILSYHASLGLESFGSEYGTVVSSCEGGNETSGSVK
jgi:hypothetical protein